MMWTLPKRPIYKGRGPIPGGPLCDILVLNVGSVDLYQDVR
jgi:hypothetical protein